MNFYIHLMNFSKVIIIFTLWPRVTYRATSPTVSWLESLAIPFGYTMWRGCTIHYLFGLLSNISRSWKVQAPTASREPSRRAECLIVYFPLNLSTAATSARLASVHNQKPTLGSC